MATEMEREEREGEGDDDLCDPSGSLCCEKSVSEQGDLSGLLWIYVVHARATRAAEPTERLEGLQHPGRKRRDRAT